MCVIEVYVIVQVLAKIFSGFLNSRYICCVCCGGNICLAG
ncbi:hypothetical protein APHNYW_1614 [Anaplasma phagocytophilum str. ApNYW]|nr:hypothetical protein APHNYW_1614 [Anaplasma phagocytophilum str. ApNYW]